MKGNRPTSKSLVRRSRIEILSCIVELCRDPMPRTHIMYKANLSQRQLNTYLKFLLRVGLIGRESNEYRITEKGFEFIKKYDRIKKLLNNDLTKDG